ncbi:MATE family efflux transporter [Parasphaerochaeta coccoides]|uniref:MATE efflux family protein n=1 Tax=Parasphaerochaeta coccoides (strain ATCC BAA-1237 / DSM 17374 / SPN1) TaxID=760011 RepID=F4GIY2_PARC1|nr:MATE family efflux transporter [Parasphaerochaeta coccoides]AEC02750.1 MATE efflux family protein [Parasphaerochaeta coccoides DSM 17374]
MQLHGKMLSAKPLRTIFVFMVPILAGNVIQQVYNLMDTVIIGQFLGAEMLAAVGTTGPIAFLVIGFAEGVAVGFSLKLAQFFGSQDVKAMKRSLATSLLLSAGISLVLTVICLATGRHLLRAMNVPADIFEASFRYISVLYIGIIASIFSTLYVGLLRSMSDSRTPLFIMICASVANVVMDIVFIGIFRMDVSVTAWTNVVAQIITWVLCVFHLRKHYPDLKLSMSDLRVTMKDIASHLGMGLPMAFQYSITALGVIMVQSSLNQLGTEAIAGYSAASKIEGFVIQPMIALATAASTFCAQNLGAKQFRRIRSGLDASLVIGLWCTLFASGVSYFLGEYLVYVFIGNPGAELLYHAVHYLKFVSYFFPALTVLFILRTCLQGMGENTVPTLGGAAELVGRALIIIWLFPSMRYEAVCLASPLAWIAAAIPLVIKSLVFVHRGVKRELLDIKERQQLVDVKPDTASYSV